MTRHFFRPMKDATVTGVLHNLRCAILRDGHDGLEQVDALLRLRGVDPESLWTPKKQPKHFARGTLRRAVLGALRDGPARASEIARRVRGNVLSCARDYKCVYQCLDSLKKAGVVRREGGGGGWHGEGEREPQLANPKAALISASPRVLADLMEPVYQFGVPAWRNADAAVFKTEILRGVCGCKSRCGHQSVIFTKESSMAQESKEMSAIKDQLAIVRAEIARLRIKEETLIELLQKVSGEPVAHTSQRKRSPSIKPLVIDIMAKAGTSGATTKDVDDAVRAAEPSVAGATVGSVLSRLKADGALVYVGERYYEKRFAPPARPFEQPLRAVN